MAKVKQTVVSTQGRPLGPPTKKARVEKAAPKPKADSARKRDTTKPKFSLRVKGSPRPASRSKPLEEDVKGKGKGRAESRDKSKIKGKGKQEQEDDDGEEEEEEDDKDEEDEDDDAEQDAIRASYKSKTPLRSQTSSKPLTKTIPKKVHLPTSFKIVAGSYEKLLYGLEGTIAPTPDSDSHPDASTELAKSPYTFTLKPLFIFSAHVSCIKAVAASPEGGKWLATGSADEIVKVWDLRRRKEIGGLMHHEGSITHLVFPSRSHLLSASEDGTLCLFRARDWSVLRALKGHKGRVNAIAVHPSGKVALSVGRDKTLRMWDLMRGKGCASTKLGKEGEIVRWSTDGSLFAVQAGSTIDVYTTNMDLIHTIKHPSRLHDVHFCKRVTGSGELLLAAAEDKQLSVYDISDDLDKTPTIVALMTGHENRVKAIQTLQIALPPLPSSERTSTTIACTVSSDGKIHVYDVAMIPEAGEKAEILPVAVYDSKGTRLTCVTLADGELDTAPVGSKRKRQGEGEDSEDKDEGDDEWPEEDEDEEEPEDEEEAEMESD
ncbi:WD40-repeat-containing domain protein [Lyophyllum atratum]|nr:WD40-repeat-containing domain protein [Lyophyllum atratum]